MGIRNLDTKARILVVNGMEKWRDKTTSNLKYHGFKNIFYASSLEKGLEIYDKESPELVITDINLPEDLEGLTLIKEIKNRNPFKTIIAMSSMNDDIKKKALDCGADDFIQKSYLKEEFNRIATQ